MIFTTKVDRVFYGESPAGVSPDRALLGFRNEPRQAQPPLGNATCQPASSSFKVDEEKIPERRREGMELSVGAKFLLCLGGIAAAGALALMVWAFQFGSRVVNTVSASSVLAKIDELDDYSAINLDELKRVQQAWSDKAFRPENLVPVPLSGKPLEEIVTLAAPLPVAAPAALMPAMAPAASVADLAVTDPVEPVNGRLALVAGPAQARLDEQSLATSQPVPAVVADSSGGRLGPVRDLVALTAHY
jgi:hypothetical protein